VVTLAWINLDEYYQAVSQRTNDSTPLAPITNKKKVKRMEFFTDHSVVVTGKLTAT
jgi:hypothetical protein